MSHEVKATEEYVFYEPQYFKYSETYRTWVKLFISDCHALTQLDGFEATRARFWKNHPIRWVQLVGVVTGVVIKARHAEIEIDDGSGCCLDLYVKGAVADTIHLNYEHNTCSVQVSDLVRVKGTLANDFKLDLQLVVEKIEVLHDPLLELSAWQERVAFKRTVLDHPWVYKSKVDGDSFRSSSSSSKHKQQDKAVKAHTRHERTKEKEERKQVSGIDLPLLDPRHHTQHNLKLVFLQYFRTYHVRKFSLRQLRACPELESAATCVARHSLVTKQVAAGMFDAEDSSQHISSTQKYRTMNACLIELVRDGSIIPLNIETGTFSVVGRWNLGKALQAIMQEMLSKDPHRSDISVRELWQAVRQSGRGFESISKQIVQKVLQEMNVESEQHEQSVTTSR